jgi:hypothetical protein
MPVNQEDKTKILLTEYQTCQESIKHQDSMAWTIGGLLLTAILIGLFQVSTNKVSIYVLWPVSLTTIVIIWLWYRIYRRWGSYVEIAAYRMQEIEKELEFTIRKNVYIDYLDGQNGIYGELEPEIEIKFSEMKNKMKTRFSKIPVHRPVKYILYLLTFLWILVPVIKTILWLN